MPTDPKAPKVFLSYSAKDAPFARLLADALNTEGIDVWFDRDEIAPGERWEEELERGLRNSDIIISLLTPESLRRPNLFFELGAAVGMRKRIIPIITSSMSASPLPVPLKQRRYLVRRPPRQLAKLLASQITQSDV